MLAAQKIIDAIAFWIACVLDEFCEWILCTVGWRSTVGEHRRRVCASVGRRWLLSDRWECQERSEYCVQDRGLNELHLMIVLT